LFDQHRQLLVETRLADVEKWIARARRSLANAVIRENRQSLLEKPALGRTQKKLGGEIVQHKRSAVIGLAIALPFHFTISVQRGRAASFLFQNDL
jgi:hypothetical protein